MIRIALCIIASLALCLPASAASSKKVRIYTDVGDMIIELYPEKAPVTVKNFLNYVDSGFYNGTIFHRALPNFMVQTGGFTWDFQKKATQSEIINESVGGLKNLYATLAMARTNDPDSADSQFFINVKTNPHLDAQKDKPGYTVFGKVIEGMDVAVFISRLAQGAHGKNFPNAPNETVRIINIEIVKPRVLIEY